MNKIYGLILILQVFLLGCNPSVIKEKKITKKLFPKTQT